LESINPKDPVRSEFSVVITVYNKEKYIARVIESVLSQTFQDFEVIVVDDGSTDGSRDAILSFDDSRIKYVHQDNSGLPAAARNKGMDLSRGRYIALLDGDDYWHKDKLMRCKEVLDKMPEVSLVSHNIAFMYKGKALRIVKFGPYVKRMYDKLLFEGNCLGPSAVVIRREVFFDDGFRFNEDKSLFALEDYEYWMQLSRKHRFYFIPDVLGYYTATDCGAFSKDTDGNAMNLLLLLDTHFAKLDTTGKNIRKIWMRRRASAMCGAGRMYNHLHKFEDSREWYLKALSEYPFSFKAFIGLVMSVLRVSVVYK